MAEAKEFVDPKDALEHGYWGASMQTTEDREASTMAGQTAAADAEKPAAKPRAAKETVK